MPVSSRQLPVSAPRVFPIQPGAGGKVMTVASALIAAQSNRNLYVSVQDSAANIRAKLPELQALGGRLIELKQTGAAQTIDLTAAQAKLYAPVLARGKGFQVSVTDSADNILANLDALQLQEVFTHRRHAVGEDVVIVIVNWHHLRTLLLG